MKQNFKKYLAVILSMLMVLSVTPISAFATFDYAHNEAESSDDYYDIISKNDWDIAPGIKESEIVLNNEAGDRRQVVHLMEADMSNEYARVISSYTNMDTSNYAISTIPEHAAFIENEWGENVVGAMNTCLSWYNSAAYAEDPSRVHEPLGFMMVDGEVYFDHSVGFPTCIVIHKDTNAEGEARPTDIPKVEMRTVTDKTCLNGWEDQVIPCSSGYIVKDGVNQQKAAHGSDTAARSVVGVKADGSIVIMMNDGRQAPYSLGMNMYECAEVMIAAGCVYAANCDGGGSSTFMSQRPGEELAVNCSPCDGSLRQNTHGIIFISTAPATGEFYNAYLSTENDYYMPYSEVEISALGRDFSGAEAKIPSEAVWSLADDSYGAINNGIFTSNGKAGTVEIKLSYNDAVVGSKTIHIVHPESISFTQSSTVIPYGKGIALDIVAMYGEFEVSYTADDFTWALSDENAGTREGLKFTATSDTSKTGLTITATYKYAEMSSAILNVNFGKGSEILYDFEDRDISNWLGKQQLIEWATVNNPNSPIFDAKPMGGNFSVGTDSTTFLATEENGKVKNGKYSLGVELDYIHSGSFGQWSYDMFFNVEGQTVLRDTANGMNATRLGMWIYIPEELAPGHNFAMQTELYCGSSSTSYARKNTHLILECNGKTLTKCTEADIPEDRWVYCYMDLTPYKYVSLQNPYQSTSDRREPQFIRFYTQSKEPFNAVFYFDDITLDYSDAVDDRNAPVISDILISTTGTTVRSFTAKAADYNASNASGLNPNTAKIYVDGISLNGATLTGGTLGTPDVTLIPGTHTVTFEIADNMGNVTKESKDFTIEGTAPITFGGHNDLNNTPEYDSIYYIDINATNIEDIRTVVADIYLNFSNTWELEHMIVADGFDATYSVDKNSNVATITVNNIDNVATGKATLVSIPVRVWSWDAEDAEFESSEIAANNYPTVYIKTDIRKGSATFVDGTTGTFNGDFNIDTAIKSSVVSSNWHAHTAEALADKEATCIADGYAGRTYCKVCGSVVEWGTTAVAKGHDWKVVSGKLMCTNGNELYNGEYEGKTYIDGVLVADGWLKVDGENKYYYVDGVRLTGSHFMDGVMYTFDEQGVYLPDYKYDGIYRIDDTVMYFVSNEYVTGNQRITGQYYNFHNNGLAYDGEVIIDGTTCLFEDGISVASGNVKLAGICGDGVQFVVYTDGRMTITGNGPMTDFKSVGNNPWYEYQYRAYIETVYIGKGVTSVGKCAFHNSPRITEVVFEEGSQLKSIHTYAFSVCPKLTTITLPEGLEVIQDSAFYNSTALKWVYMPSSLTTIGGYAFGEITQNITMNVLEGSFAQGYAKYQKINCELRLGVIGSGVCGTETKWILYSDGSLYISGNGEMTDYTYHKYGETAAPWAIYRSDIKKVVIESGVTVVGNFAFYSCTNLKAVEFAQGSTVKEIGVGAFGYTGLINVTVPASLEEISDNAFYFCGNLEEVAFEEESRLFVIGELAFRNCTSLKKVYIPDSVNKMGAVVFYACGSELVLDVADGLYTHEYARQNGYTVVTHDPAPVILYSGSCGEKVVWSLYNNGDMVISGSGEMTDYTYHKYGETAAPWAIYRSDIKKVVIESGVTVVGNFAFYNCSNLSEVEFAADSAVKTIGIGAFGYTGLINVTLPASLEEISDNAFYFCGNLEEVAFEEEGVLTTIGDYAFRNCTSLKKVYIQNTVTMIGEVILYACGEEATLYVANGSYAHKYATSKKYNVVTF